MQIRILSRKLHLVYVQHDSPQHSLVLAPMRFGQSQFADLRKEHQTIVLRCNGNQTTHKPLEHLADSHLQKKATTSAWRPTCGDSENSLSACNKDTGEPLLWTTSLMHCQRQTDILCDVRISVQPSCYPQCSARHAIVAVNAVHRLIGRDSTRLLNVVQGFLSIDQAPTYI